MSHYWLRQSTASQEVSFPAILSATDLSAQTGLTVANTDIKITKAGATAEASKNNGGATHKAAGRYYCVLDATDTDTVGSGRIDIAMSGTLPVGIGFTVLAQAVYDVMFGTTAPSTFAGGAVASVTGAVGSVTGNVGGNVAGSVGSVAAGGITANSLAADCITAAKIATGAIDADAIADGAIDNGALADGAISAAKLATGAITAAKFAAGAIDAAAIATDAIDADAIKADAVTEIQSGLATTTQMNAVEADTQDIQARLPAALVSGRMASDAVAVSGSTAAADAVEANIGNLDAAVSTRASQASVDDVPTNAELANALAAADDATLAAVAAVLAAVGQVKAKTDALPASPAAVADIPTAAAVADTTLRRTMAHVEQSGDGDAPSLNSLYGAVQQMQKASVSGSTLTVQKTDGTTLGTRTLTSDPDAEPITGVA